MFHLYYITHPDSDTAHRIANQLVEEKLVACANILPIESMYWWQGAVQREGEVVSIVKAPPEKEKSVEDRVRELHPYEVPCIIRMEVHANADYEAWIRDETGVADK